jgi:hypothetical protein
MNLFRATIRGYRAQLAYPHSTFHSERTRIHDTQLPHPSSAQLKLPRYSQRENSAG